MSRTREIVNGVSRILEACLDAHAKGDFDRAAWRVVAGIMDTPAVQAACDKEKRSDALAYLLSLSADVDEIFERDNAIATDDMPLFADEIEQSEDELRAEVRRDMLARHGVNAA